METRPILLRVARALGLGLRDDLDPIPRIAKHFRYVHIPAPHHRHGSRRDPRRDGKHHGGNQVAA
jgi:hypothetical protein